MFDDKAVWFAFFSGMLWVCLGMPKCIRFLKRWSIGQMIQGDGPDHAHKASTPTMGGVWLALGMLWLLLVYVPLNDPYLPSIAWTCVATSALGAWDDYSKIIYTNNDLGLRPKQKLIVQGVVAAVAMGLFLHTQEGSSALTTWFFPGAFSWALHLDIGWLGFGLWGIVVMAGASNAVNLTDGLDGLASGLIVFASLGFIAVILLRPDLPLAAGIERLDSVMVLLVGLVGLFLGFLHFNKRPAQVFMGDSGSLTAGALLGLVALILKMEFLCAVLAGVFVVETFSVMIQVGVFKKTGRRFFKMAPLHHHYELSGYSETQVVRGFWVAGALSALLGVGLWGVMFS